MKPEAGTDARTGQRRSFMASSACAAMVAATVEAGGGCDRK